MESIQEHFEKELKKLSQKRLIEAFNQNVGLSAWGNARAHYLVALKKELQNRKWDCSLILSESHLSLAKKVALKKKKMIFVD